MGEPAEVAVLGFSEGTEPACVCKLGVCIWRPESNIRCHSSGAIYFVFETGSLTGTGVHGLG